jgi:hypothetical protein
MKFDDLPRHLDVEEGWTLLVVLGETLSLDQVSKLCEVIETGDHTCKS